MTEYAPEYTKKEKIIITLKNIAWALPLLLICQLGFFPWLEQYANNEPCYQYGSITNMHLIFYGIFVGIPLSITFLLLALQGSRNLNILKLGQAPLPNEKVFAQTKYTYGTKAKWRAYVFFIVVALICALSIQGVFWANDMLSQYDLAELPKCIVQR